MSQYDEYFTNDDKPFAENLNDALLVSNVFDLAIPIVLPDDFSNGAWVDTGNKRKCHVSIVQVTDFDNLTVAGSSLTGYGALRFSFYPNFNSFGKIRGVDWNGSVDEVIVNDANGNLLCSVTEPGNFPNVSGLRTLQNFEIIVKVNGELEDLTLRLENKVKSARYTVSATVDDIDGLSDALDSIETINSNQDLLIENKVDKVNGKCLSTNDYTNADKAKVSSLKAVATSGNYSDLNDKPTIPAKTSDLVNDGADGTNVYVSNNDSRLSNARTPTAHSHGNVTNDGKIGSTSGKIVVTGTNGVLQGVDTITKSKISDFSHTHTKSQISDFSHIHTKSQISDFSHAHGNISNDGKIGSASGKIITTGTNGVLQAVDTITKAKISDFPSTMTPSSHSHGSLANGGTLNSDISSVNKVAVTDSSNNLKTISKVPFANLNITKANITGLGIPGSDTNTTYTAGDGLTLSGTTFKHSNRVTGMLGTLQVIKCNVDSEGHISDFAKVLIDSTSGGTASSSDLITSGAVASAVKWQTLSLTNMSGCTLKYNDMFCVLSINGTYTLSVANVYTNLVSGTIPSGYRPDRRVTGLSDGGVLVRFRVSTDGTLDYYAPQTISSSTYQCKIIWER